MFSLLLNMMICLLVSYSSMAQVTPEAAYNFDNADLSEASNIYNSGTAKNNDNYECGVGQNSQALHLTGSDTIALDPNIKSLFEGDFSLSFDFWIDAKPNVNYAVFSIQDSCTRDSSLSITYIEQLNEIRLEFARDITQSVFFSEPLDETLCWHYLAFTKAGDTYSFYLDGKFVESVLFVNEVVLGRDAQIHLGYSPCVGNFESMFEGRIDNVQFYDGTIDDETVSSINNFPDQITSADTTLFQGDSYQLNTGPSCAAQVSWSPTQGLDDPSSFFPIATPDETTDYLVTFNHGSCVSSDTVRISVLSEESIDCNNILIPNAFTPNGDKLNDEIGISNNFIIDDLNRFEIYDRWGLKLFETVNKNEPWDGRYKGQGLMPGTYVYKVDYSCRDVFYQKTGSFNLIK